MADISLEYAWSTDDAGNLTVELLDAAGNAIAGTFTFDEETLIGDLNDDLEETANTVEVGDVMVEWMNLADNFKELSDAIKKRLATSIH